MKRPRPPWLLVGAVLALHLLLGHEVQRIADGWRDDRLEPMPARMQVEFVREMAVAAAPPPPAPRPPAPAPAPLPAPPPAAPVEAASAPERTADAASAPEPLAEAEPAASAADDVMAAAASAAESPAASAASAPVADAGDEPGPEWPLSTRLSYELTGHYRGPVHGQAQVEWARRGSDYQVHLDVAVGPSFAPLVSRRMSSQGRLTPTGIAPQRYDEETRVIVGGSRRASVFFEGAAVQLAHGAREPALAGVQDSASQFVQLTWLFLTGRELLQPGNVVRFPLALPRRQYAHWGYEVVGETWVETRLGWLPAWHLRPVQPARGGDLSAEVWLAPGLQFLPVRLVIRQDAETHIDLMLKSLPVQAAPESPP